MNKLLIILTVIIVCSCGRLTPTLLDPAAKITPLAENAPVEVITGEPDRPYQPIAILDVSRKARTAFGSVKAEQVIEDLKAQARTMGCSAIKDVEITDYYAMSLNFRPTIPAKHGKAIGIKWIEKDGD